MFRGGRHNSTNKNNDSVVVVITALGEKKLQCLGTSLESEKMSQSVLSLILQWCLLVKGGLALREIYDCLSASLLSLQAPEKINSNGAWCLHN